eukprot:g490.t1
MAQNATTLVVVGTVGIIFLFLVSRTGFSSWSSPSSASSDASLPAGPACNIPDIKMDPLGSLPQATSVKFTGDAKADEASFATLTHAVSEAQPLVLRGWHRDLGWATPASMDRDYGHVRVPVLRKPVWVSEGGLLKLGNNTSLQPDAEETGRLADFLSGAFVRGFPDTETGRHTFEWKHKVDPAAVRQEMDPAKGGKQCLGPDGATATSMDCRIHTELAKVAMPPCKKTVDGQDGAFCPLSGHPTYRVQYPYFFFGMHYDCYDNLLLQLHGRKRVGIFQRPGGESGQRSVADVGAGSLEVQRTWRRNVMEASLEPGDALFLPMGWFHSVETITCEMSIFSNFAIQWAGDATYQDGMDRCAETFARDYPLRNRDIKENRDYKDADGQYTEKSHEEDSEDAGNAAAEG